MNGNTDYTYLERKLLRKERIMQLKKQLVRPHFTIPPEAVLIILTRNVALKAATISFAEIDLDADIEIQSCKIGEAKQAEQFVRSKSQKVIPY